jgi:uncharacterized protein YndB with AHSA1/START domain
MSESKDGRELRLEIEIAASPETVFALLTQAAGLKTWLSDLVVTDCRPGGIYRITAHAVAQSKGRIWRLCRTAGWCSPGAA